MLETSEELRAALVQGLDTLVAISYVDDDEVRWVVFVVFHFVVCAGGLGVGGARRYSLCSDERGGSVRGWWPSATPAPLSTAHTGVYYCTAASPEHRRSRSA